MPNQILKIYHNPRCSKSRETLKLIEEAKVKHEIIEYLNDTPDASEILRITRLLGISARELLRTGEDAYQLNNLSNVDLSEEAIISIICDNPILLERPIVVSGNRAIIGRPPSRVFDIIES